MIHHDLYNRRLGLHLGLIECCARGIEGLGQNICLLCIRLDESECYDIVALLVC